MIALPTQLPLKQNSFNQSSFYFAKNSFINPFQIDNSYVLNNGWIIHG